MYTIPTIPIVRMFGWLVRNTPPLMWWCIIYSIDRWILRKWRNKKYSEWLEIVACSSLHSFVHSRIILSFIGDFYCVKSVRIRSYSGPHFPTFGLIRDQKIRTRATPNTDIFYPVFKSPEVFNSFMLIFNYLNKNNKNSLGL